MTEVHEKTAYLVLLVDRKKTVMFMLLDGMAVERYQEFSVNDVPQNVRTNEENFYGRSDKIFRHIEDHLHRHLKRVAETVALFVDREKITGVFLGGHGQLFKKIKKHLPLNLSRKVKGTFVTELNIPFNDILRKSKQIIKEFEADTSFIFASK